MCKGKSIGSSGELGFDEARRIRLSTSDERTQKTSKRMLSETNGVIFREYQSGRFAAAGENFRINPDIKVVMEVKNPVEYMSWRAVGSVKIFLSRCP